MSKTNHVLADDSREIEQELRVVGIKAYDRLFSNDDAFDWIYPDHIEALSKKHWTPLDIARKAAGFLAEPGATILDIGSGAGKFCLAGAYYHPGTFFCGVEQRYDLVICAEDAKSYLKLQNANFFYANATQMDFGEFDHFYFYNSFYENIDDTNAIDDTIATSYSLYAYYTQYLFAELNKKPRGTKLVTFHTIGEEVPPSYQLAAVSHNTLLKMWIKK